MNRNKTFVIIIIVLLVAVAVFAVVNNGQKAKDGTKAAIDFSLTDQYGQSHTLSDYKGKAVFVNFWATWCPPCRNELPDFQKTYEKFGKNEDDIVILGVYAPGFDKEGTSKEVIDYFEGQGLDYPILADEGGKAFADYAISGLPTTVMIDKDGQEVGRHTGALTADELTKTIQSVRER